MSQDSISILHLDTERGWRGGQQQAVYLYESLLAKNIKTHFVCRKGSQLEHYFVEQNLPFTALPLKNEIDLYSAFKIAKYCKKNKYSILHLHAAHALAIGLFGKLFYSELKLIGVRRVDFHIKNNFLSQLKYKNSLLDKLVCISRAIKNVAIEDGIDEDKLEIIHSGIDIHKFDDSKPGENYRQKLGIPQDCILIGTVAALVGHKDYPTLLRAARIVIQSNQNIYFCAAGAGYLEEELKALHRELDLQDRFKFLGFRNDIWKFLKSLDIFVLSSKMEGLGTSVLDAMAVGLPVVGTRAGGIPESVKDGENGLLAPAQEPKALAEKIRMLAADHKLQKELGQKAKKMVKEFSIENTVQKNINLYKQLKEND